MKRIKVQFTATLLIAVIFLSSVLVPAKPAYAIAGFDDAAFILAMLAAAGAGYIGYSSYNSGNSNLAEDLWGELDDLEDDVSDAFDKAVFKVLEGGGGGSDPNDFDPDNDDPEKKPTTWAKLKEWWKKHPNASLNLAGNGCVISSILPEFFTRLSKKKLESTTSTDDLSKVNFSNAQLKMIMKYINEYPFYFLSYDVNSSNFNYIYMSASYFYVWGSKDLCRYAGGPPCIQLTDNLLVEDINSIGGGFSSHPSYFMTNVPIYSSLAEAQANFDNDMADYLKSLNPKSVLNTTAKNDALDKDNYEEPVYDNVVLPTPDQMTNYANQLQAIAQSDAEPAVKKEQQQQAMNTFVESITNVKEMPKPDPSPDPDPSPNPDPSPDPDPSPEPDPDAPATDEEAAPYTADLTTVFPFCIPFDLIRAFKVLSAEGEAPVYKMPLKIDYKSIHVSEAWQIDMSDFASVIQILRVMETLGFIVGLILVTRKLIRG